MVAASACTPCDKRCAWREMRRRRRPLSRPANLAILGQLHTNLRRERCSSVQRGEGGGDRACCTDIAYITARRKLRLWRPTAQLQQEAGSKSNCRAPATTTLPPNAATTNPSPPQTPYLLLQVLVHLPRPHHVAQHQAAAGPPLQRSARSRSLVVGLHGTGGVELRLRSARQPQAMPLLLCRLQATAS